MRNGHAAEGKLVSSCSTAYELGEADLEPCGCPTPAQPSLGPNQGQAVEAVGSSLTQELAGLLGHPAIHLLCGPRASTGSGFISFPAGGGWVG